MKRTVNVQNGEACLQTSLLFILVEVKQPKDVGLKGKSGAKHNLEMNFNCSFPFNSHRWLECLVCSTVKTN